MKSLLVGDRGPSGAVVGVTATGNSLFDVKVGLSMNIPSESFGCLTNADGRMLDEGGFKIASSSSMRSYNGVNNALL